MNAPTEVIISLIAMSCAHTKTPVSLGTPIIRYKNDKGLRGREEENDRDRKQITQTVSAFIFELRRIGEIACQNMEDD